MMPGSREWIKRLRFMRIACPAALLAAIALGTWAYSQENYILVAINLVLMAVNSRLTYVQWFVLQPQWPGRRV